MDYSQGKIYKITDESNGDIYIGSTAQSLDDRFLRHELFRKDKSYCKNKSNCKISLVEEYPCENKRKLEMREQAWIDRIDCINQKRAFTSIEMEKEVCKKRSSKYYYENKEYCMREQRKRQNKVRQWETSMGGRKDQNNNSLIKIHPNLFT
tara:strand:- start:4865 stop:5317 length:453 start_codon:yes stop_codon:yes gene_type:complete